jgi:hypothetical protein
MNRRAFLKTTASAAAAAAFVPASHAAPKRDLRKAIMYSTIGVKGSVLDKFKAMKAGFEGVEPLGAMNATKSSPRSRKLVWSRERVRSSIG